MAKYSILKCIEYTPPKPPRALGYIDKMGGFIINFNLRFIEIDPIVGSFRRYLCRADYPLNPM